MFRFQSVLVYILIFCKLLHTQRVFTQDWLNPFWVIIAFCVLLFISHGKQSDECTKRRRSLSSITVNKLFIVICVFCCPCSVVIASCLSHFFEWCCLFVNHVNKCIIFVFVAFIYHFYVKRQQHFNFLNSIKCDSTT